MIRGADGRGCSPRLQVVLLPDNGTKSMKLLAVAAVKEEEEEDGRGGLAKWLAVRQTRPSAQLVPFHPPCALSLFIENIVWWVFTWPERCCCGCGEWTLNRFNAGADNTPHSPPYSLLSALFAVPGSSCLLFVCCSCPVAVNVIVFMPRPCCCCWKLVKWVNFFRPLVFRGCSTLKLCGNFPKKVVVVWFIM